MIGKYDFDYYKEHVSIPQVLTALGYKWNRSAGRTVLEFEKRDVITGAVDKLLVFHPTKPYATVCHRGERGVDLIKFVQQNLHQFPAAAGCRNDVDGINRVLAAFANVEHDAGFQLADAMAKINGTLQVAPPEQMAVWDDSVVTEKQPFDLNRYERDPGNVEKAMAFLATRGISEETARLFSGCYEITRDTQATKFKFRNLSFPYTKAGTPYHVDRPEDIVGYEVRGFGKFKNKAAGTDSKFGCWQAYLGSDPKVALSPFGITQLHFAESALDIMSYVQLNRDKLDLDRCLFISVGGTPSVEQLRGVVNAYSIALPVLHFDNDENGVGYDCQMAAVLAGKTFSIAHNRKADDPRINFMLGEKAFTIDARGFSYDAFREASGLRNISLRIEKPPYKYKDWNDILLDRMNKPLDNDLKQANARVQAMAQGAAATTGTENPSVDDSSPRKGRGI